MQVEQLPFTHFLNKILGAPVAKAMDAIGVQPSYPAAPITNFVAMQILAFLVLLVLFIAVKARLSVEKPGGLQQFFEGFHDLIAGQAREIIGPQYARFTPFLAALGLYILTCNLMGLVPGLESPTAVPSVPLGCALAVWFYYQWQGVREHGFGYIKNFMGPVWWLAPLMFLIEVCSHLARIMSLTIRLFANMFAGDMVTLVFFSLVPIGIPVIFMGLHLGVSLLQAYIFVLLPMIYLSEATGHAH